MDEIKFKIKREGLGFIWYLLVNEALPIALILMAASFSIENKSILLFVIIIIPLVPIFLFIWCRNTVIVKKDKLIVRFGLGYFHVVVDISSVSNVHYKQKKELILGPFRRSFKIPLRNFQELEISGVNVHFQKREETVCFTSARGNHYYLAVKEHQKLYELLKKREVYPEAE